MVRRCDDCAVPFAGKVGVLRQTRSFQERTASPARPDLVRRESPRRARTSPSRCATRSDRTGRRRSTTPFRPRWARPQATLPAPRSRPRRRITPGSDANCGTTSAPRLAGGAGRRATLFGIIYSIDDTDDAWDEATWIKANPAWGVSVQPDAIRAIICGESAEQPPRIEKPPPGSRHLNVWIEADERALFDPRMDAFCADRDLRIEDFEGRECHLRPRPRVADRSRRSLVAVVSGNARRRTATLHRVLPVLPEQDPPSWKPATRPIRAWAAENALIITPGNETDFQTIEDDTVDLVPSLPRSSRWPTNPAWRTTQLAQRLQSSSVPPSSSSCSNTQSFSAPTRELEGGDPREPHPPRRERAARVVHRQRRRPHGRARQRLSTQGAAGEQDRRRRRADHRADRTRHRNRRSAPSMKHAAL